ncbi:hypothetical protein Tco_0709865 [Tanacetum coccineum]
MLGASGVQISQNNLDNLQSIREEDGTSEMVDPQDCLGSLVLEDLDSIILALLFDPTDLDVFDFLLEITVVILVRDRCPRGKDNLPRLPIRTNIVLEDKSTNKVKESPDTLLVEELVSDDKIEKKIVFHTVDKINFIRAKQQEKLVRKPFKYAEMYRPKVVNTARPNLAVVNAVRANQVNAVKALACWVWRPTKLNSASITLKKHNYVDARGKPIRKSMWRIGASRGLLRDLSRGLVALLLRLRSPLGKVSLLCHSRFWQCS